jgi:DNA-binding transcriptional LysR family regulator
MRGAQFAQLTAFVAVAEHSSFTRAAAYLGMSTPSLSQTIRALEEQFGVRLLNRTTRSVALTDAGAELLNHLSPVMEGVDRAVDAVNAFRAKPAGTLRLVVHPVAAATVVAPLVARFSAENPDIRLEIRVSNERTDIVGEHFDAGIYLGDDVARDMIAVPIGEKFRLVMVAAPAYLARSAPLSAPGDLKRHSVIRYCWSGRNADPVWKLEKGGQATEVDVNASLTVDDPDFALRAALDGVGIVPLPDAMVDPLVAQGRLVPVLTDWTVRSSDFVLFYASRRHVPVKLRALVDFLRREIRRARRGGNVETMTDRTIPFLERNGGPKASANALAVSAAC